MSHTLIIIQTDSEVPADRGRVLHALKLARELKEGGHPVEVLFQGKGVTWIPKFADRTEESHPFFKVYGAQYDAIADKISVCNMCSKRFDVNEDVQRLGLPILGEGRDHASLLSHVTSGAQIVTF